MKFFPILIIVFLSQLSFSQEHSSLFQPETMKKNRVLKVLEYHPEDSVEFFKKFPEGYYSKYDRSGRMVESNSYSSYESKEGIWVPNIFRNYYIYDSLGKNIAFISKYDDGDQPFRSINITSAHKSGDSMDLATLTREYKPDFRFTTEPIKEKTAFFGDTIEIGKRHKRLIAIEDSAMYMDLYFNKQGWKDSMVFYGKGYTHTGRKNIPHTNRSVTHYSYFKDGTLKSAVKRNSQTTNGLTKLDYEEVYSLLENGLLDTLKRTTYYDLDKGPITTFSKFMYTFRKE